MVMDSGRMESNECKLKHESSDLHMATVEEWNRLPTEAVKTSTSPLQSSKFLSLYAPSFFPYLQYSTDCHSASSLLVFT